jgi:hypothetical protein
MTATKTKTIRLEKVERLVLPNVFQRFCQNCQLEQVFVSTEQATFLTGLTMRRIFRLVEIGAIHFFETEEGFLFICESSLKKENASLKLSVLDANKNETEVKLITK